jgi:hypothetical protein
MTNSVRVLVLTIQLFGGMVESVNSCIHKSNVNGIITMTLQLDPALRKTSGKLAVLILRTHVVEYCNGRKLAGVFPLSYLWTETESLSEMLFIEWRVLIR